MEELNFRILARHAENKGIQIPVGCGKNRLRAILMNHVAHRFFYSDGFGHVGFSKRPYKRKLRQAQFSLGVRLVIP